MESDGKDGMSVGRQPEVQGVFLPSRYAKIVQRIGGHRPFRDRPLAQSGNATMVRWCRTLSLSPICDLPPVASQTYSCIRRKLMTAVFSDFTNATMALTLSKIRC
mgnify:CR=1 FL=1